MNASLDPFHGAASGASADLPSINPKVIICNYFTAFQHSEEDRSDLIKDLVNASRAGHTIILSVPRPIDDAAASLMVEFKLRRLFPDEENVIELLKHKGHLVTLHQNLDRSGDIYIDGDNLPHQVRHRSYLLVEGGYNRTAFSSLLNGNNGISSSQSRSVSSP